MHNAPMFVNALKLFLNDLNPNHKTQKKVLELPLLFHSLDVWHQVKITPSSLFDNDVVTETIKAVPVWKGSTTCRSDTVIVLEDETAESTGITGQSTLHYDTLFVLH